MLEPANHYFLPFVHFQGFALPASIERAVLFGRIFGNAQVAGKVLGIAAMGKLTFIIIIFVYTFQCRVWSL